MLWSKVAAPLQAALADGEPAARHPVFVQCAPGAPRPDPTERFPMRPLTADTYTANLDHAAVDTLSEQPWVASISLAEQASPSSGSDAGGTGSAPPSMAPSVARPRPPGPASDRR